MQIFNAVGLAVLAYQPSSFQIRESNIDVIGFQEVRFNKKGDNQVLQLQTLLPKHKWIYYGTADKVSIRDDSISNDWNSEGEYCLT